MRHSPVEIEIKVGFFVCTGIALLMIAALGLTRNQNFFSKKINYHTYFHTVDGLIPGSKVILNGVSIGIVSLISLDKAKQGIRVEIMVSQDATDWIKKGSSIEILTQGILGDKYLSILPGTQDHPLLPYGSEIPARPTKDLSEFLTQGDQLMGSLRSITNSLDRIFKRFESNNRHEIFFKNMTEVSKNLSALTEKINREIDKGNFQKVVTNLEEILEKINNGSGSIGALINDPSLYDELKTLFGGVNRNRIMRNLVRQSMQNQIKAGQATPKE